MSVTIHQQLHGYQGGHQLLKTSIDLDPEDQDVIDHLSDIAGPIRPGERFSAYISAYPLPTSEYYAFARTQQDVDATRAGCVTTKTLLIPTAFWGHQANPAALALLLDGSTEIGPIMDADRLPVPALTPVHTPVFWKLVEALFLERCRHIAVFGAPFPIEVVLRLLTALWPDMRRSISLCTYALSPRVLAGGSFNLQFVPEGVRDRFADWRGRRIDVVGEETSIGKRWAGILTERIFLSATPHLVNVDVLRMLVGDEIRKDERILGLSLRWDELRDRVATTPSAVLGLIDIASSRDTAESMWSAVEQPVVRAVTTAAASLEIAEARRFFRTLITKLRGRKMTRRIREALWASGAKLVQRDWRSALDFLAEEITSTSQQDSNVLLESIASAVAKTEVEQLTQALLDMSAHQLIRLALLDDGILNCIFSSTDSITDARFIKALGDGFWLLSAEDRSLERKRLLHCIRGDRDSQLLMHLVFDVGTAEMVDAVNLVWSATARRTVRLGEALCASALTGGSRREVRNAFARLGSDEQTVRCVDRLVAAEPGDVMWLLDSSEIGPRAAFFLSSLIRRSSSEEMRRAFCARDVGTRALGVLARDLRLYRSEAVRIVVLPCVPSMTQIDVGLKIFPMVEGSDRRELAQSLATRVLTDATVQSGVAPERVISSVIDDVDMRSAIETGLASTRSGREVSLALVLLSKAGPEIVCRIVKDNGRLIVKLVAGRAVFDLSVDGAAAVSKFLDTAERLGIPTHVELCSTILPFAMSTRKEGASRIVVSAFPTVYRELRKERVDSILVDFFGLFDWDKCKVARRDLVRSFMKSKWPPADLAVTALRTHDLRRILVRLLKEPGGRNYLSRIKDGIQRFEAGIRKPIENTIGEVQESYD